MKEIYNKVLDAVALDPRLESGIFDVLNNDHLSLFREYLTKEGLSEEQSIFASNKLAEAGRFPDRQAYNSDGILVTFPTPEYKQRALARGTHFEENPKKAQVNIFQGTPAQPAQPAQPKQVQQTQAVPQQAPQAPQAVPQQTQPIDQPTVQAADVRTPEEKEQDANAVEKMLKTEYTLEECKQFGFYSKKGVWYNTEGNIVGREWYIENLGKKMILPC
jgi:hypothetical protein